MDRRTFISGVASGLFVAPLLSFAQQQRAIPRIGFLISETLSVQANRVDALRAGLGEHGYVEGKNIIIEMRSADGAYGRLSELAAELIKLPLDPARQCARARACASQGLRKWSQ